MKKITILKKNQNSSLSFFLAKIKKRLKYFIRRSNSYLVLKKSLKKSLRKFLKKNLKKNLFIYHNQILFLPIFFDLIIFFRKSTNKPSLFLKFFQKKQKIKAKFFRFASKSQKFKPKLFIDLYLKFISFVFKKGKFFFWENAFALIFNNLSLKFHYSRSLILAKLFIRLFTRVELKKVKSRKRVSFIPFFIKCKRSLFLAFKWIFLSTTANTTSTSFQNKLYIELVQILSLKSCFSLKKLEENNINSFNNRSNVHYRWNRKSL